MTKIVASRYANKLKSNGISATPRHNYSGQNGETTNALVLDAALLEQAKKVCPRLTKYRQDTAGAELVIY